MDDLSHERAVAVAAAEKAGLEIARMREEGLRYGHKADDEVVTEADLHASEILHEAITGAFPHDGWLGEEEADNDERLTKDRVWIVDPIDGTREYIQGLPQYAVSIGLAIKGEAVLGVVHMPATGGTKVATVGDANALDLPPTRDENVVLVSRGEYHMGDLPPLPPGSSVAPVGSVALRLALIADGQGHAVTTWNPRSEWDIAGGVPLCVAAGMTVTDIEGKALRFNKPDPMVNGLVVAEPALHARMLRYLEPRD